MSGRSGYTTDSQWPVMGGVPNRMPVFTPTGNEPLLVRGTIGGPFDTSVKHLKSTTHDRHQYKRPTPSPAHSWPASRPATSPGSRFGELSRSSFFSRHNPHPVRVRHIKGLNDIPICAVHDTGFVSSPRWNLSTPGTAQRERIFKHHMPVNAIGINSTKFPINTVTGLQNFPFKEKAVPRIGLVPVASMNNTWRDELKDIVEKAGLAPPTEQELKDRDLLPKRQTKYSKETGRLIPPPSRAMSRQASRQGSRQGGRYNHFMHISPDPNAEVLILQTDSIQAVQQWLVNATGRGPVDPGRQSHPPEVLRIDSPQEGQTAPPVRIPPAHRTPSPAKTSHSRQAQSATAKMEAPEQPKLRYTKTPTSQGRAGGMTPEPPADNMQ
uniref:Uncharacterized protein n=1 Tax=Branchiostoma floridae TaxID=7739 RepID=C3Z591_BRAFL|eukprot:XP_002595992.1 hypothetical protein BRAFLDRAFT_123731 [Branchiostoma floridae]